MNLSIQKYHQDCGENKSANCSICNIVITSDPNGFRYGIW